MNAKQNAVNALRSATAVLDAWHPDLAEMQMATLRFLLEYTATQVDLIVPVQRIRPSRAKAPVALAPRDPFARFEAQETGR
jgi:hypothetical protein